MIAPSPNLSIRPYEVSDVECVKDWFYSGLYPEFFRDMPALTEEQLKVYAYMKDGQGFIVRNNQGVKVGFIILHEVRAVPRNCKLSILIDRNFQEKGYCLEAMVSMAKYIFFRLGMEKMIVECLESNTRLQKLTEQGGFNKECVLIREARIENDLVNVVRYTMFKEQFIEVLKGLGG